MNSRHNVKRQRVKRQPFLVTIDKFQAPKFTVAILCAQNSKIYGLDFSKYIKSRIERYFTISTPGNAGYAYIYLYVSLYVHLFYMYIHRSIVHCTAIFGWFTLTNFLTLFIYISLSVSIYHCLLLFITLHWYSYVLYVQYRSLIQYTVICRHWFADMSCSFLFIVFTLSSIPLYIYTVQYFSFLVFSLSNPFPLPVITMYSLFSFFFHCFFLSIPCDHCLPVLILSLS